MTHWRRVDGNPHRGTARTTRGACAAWTAVLAAGLSLAGTADAAAELPSVTLADALRQALRPDNPVLQQQSDSVAATAGRLQAAQGAFDWRADVSGGWQQYYVAHPVNGVLTSQTDIVSGYYYSVDMAKQFRNGVEIAPGVTAYPGTNATPGQTAGQTEMRPQLGLKIPLMRGSGSSVDAPERAAQAALQAARASRGFAQQQMAQTVAATFWRCIADAQVRGDAEQTRSHVDAYRGTLEKEREKGVVEPTLVQQFTANNVWVKLNLDKAQDEETRCRRDLGYLLTGDVDQQGPVPAGQLPDIEAVGPALDKLKDQDLVQLALDQRQDLDAAARNLSAAHENVVGAKTFLLPQLDVRVDPQRAFVTFSRPFGNNYGKGRSEEARAQENSAMVTLRYLQDQVRTQVSDSLTGLRRARSDWTTIVAAEAQMATVVSDAEKRARLGLISWSDYLTAQNQLTSLHQQEIGARLAFAVNLSLLELATGSMNPDRPTELAQSLATLPAL